MKISNTLFASTVTSTFIALLPSFSSTAFAFAFSSPNASLDNQLTTASSTTFEYEVNTEEAFASSTFPIEPDDLINRAKEVLSKEINLGVGDGGKCLSPDFIFRAQFVEVEKEGYINALKSFNLQDSFDIQPNFFGFSVDPMQTNRVWFFSRSVASHTGAFAGVEATGKVLTLPPQTFHLDFDEDGLIKEVGFYTVDRAQGNTGGLGGAFAYFYGVGKPLPFPEGKPYKASFKYRMIQKIGNIMQKIQKKKKD
mmetsp:Transcript_1259/g.1534  ORF Transcript_1259/g.1534 Transcript_1259/m.1534 type:complete len:253 (-) Transcript_1259:1282-2040(-)